MKPNRFTKYGKALLCEVLDIHVIVRRRVIRGFPSIPIRAAVKFTEKDKYCRSYVQEAFNQVLVGTDYEQQWRMIDIVLYMEFYKRQRPSMYVAEEQKSGCLHYPLTCPN